MMLAPLPARRSLSKAETDVPSRPETADRFNATANREWPGQGRSISGSSESYLGQQRGALAQPNTLKLPVISLSFKGLKAHHMTDTGHHFCYYEFVNDTVVLSTPGVRIWWESPKIRLQSNFTKTNYSIQVQTANSFVQSKLSNHGFESIRSQCTQGPEPIDISLGGYQHCWQKLLFFEYIYSEINPGTKERIEDNEDNARRAQIRYIFFSYAWDFHPNQGKDTCR